MKRIKLFLFSLFSPSFWPHSLQPIVALLFCVHFLYYALDKMSCSFFFWCGKTPEYIRITLDIHKIQIKQIFSMEIRNDCWKNNDGVKRIMCKWMVCVCWCMCGGKYRKIIIIYKAAANLPLSRNGHDEKSDKIENPKT